MFAIVDAVEVAVDPQHDLPEDVICAVRVGDAAPDEGLQLRAELPPDLLGGGVVRAGPGVTRGRSHIALLSEVGLCHSY